LFDLNQHAKVYPDEPVLKGLMVICWLCPLARTSWLLTTIGPFCRTAEIPGNPTALLATLLPLIVSEVNGKYNNMYRFIDGANVGVRDGNALDG
jgi:hypothetical protein